MQLLSLFANRYKNHPETSMSVKRTASEGDLVWIHLHAKRTPEAPLVVAAIHIFRMEGSASSPNTGALVQAVPEKSANDNNTMF